MAAWTGVKRKGGHDLEATWAQLLPRLSSSHDCVVRQGSRVDPDTKIVHKRLKDLIRRAGIPTAYRSDVWRITSGCAQRQQTHASVYSELLYRFEAETSSAVTQINKDVGRTFLHGNAADSADSPALSPDFYGQLKRVLVAYSWFNPSVGYCQSMNFVCTILLLYLSEEEAFWMLSVIIEQILPPHFYSPTLQGLHTECKVFVDVMAVKQPKLAAHLKALEVNVETIVAQWFLCLFINVLPLEATLRFLDSFFVEGSKMLFRVGLALFKLHEKKILSLTTFEDAFLFVQQLPKSASDTHRLMQLAFDRSWLGSFPQSLIDTRRLERTRETAELVKNRGHPIDPANPSHTFRVIQSVKDATAEEARANPSNAAAVMTAMSLSAQLASLSACEPVCATSGTGRSPSEDSASLPLPPPRLASPDGSDGDHRHALSQSADKLSKFFGAQVDPSLRDYLRTSPRSSHGGSAVSASTPTLLPVSASPTAASRPPTLSSARLLSISSDNRTLDSSSQLSPRGKVTHHHHPSVTTSPQRSQSPLSTYSSTPAGGWSRVSGGGGNADDEASQSLMRNFSLSPRRVPPRDPDASSDGSLSPRRSHFVIGAYARGATSPALTVGSGRPGANAGSPQEMPADPQADFTQLLPILAPNTSKITSSVTPELPPAHVRQRTASEDLALPPSGLVSLSDVRSRPVDSRSLSSSPSRWLSPRIALQEAPVGGSQRGLVSGASGPAATTTGLHHSVRTPTPLAPTPTPTPPSPSLNRHSSVTTSGRGAGRGQATLASDAAAHPPVAPLNLDTLTYSRGLSPRVSPGRLSPRSPGHSPRSPGQSPRDNFTSPAPSSAKGSARRLSDPSIGWAAAVQDRGAQPPSTEPNGAAVPSTPEPLSSSPKSPKPADGLSKVSAADMPLELTLQAIAREVRSLTHSLAAVSRDPGS